jgi:hypothetical protein
MLTHLKQKVVVAHSPTLAKIHTLRGVYMRNAGLAPKFLYVGKSVYYTLIQELQSEDSNPDNKSYTNCTLDSDSKHALVSLIGMQVIVVYTEAHINVSY